MFHRETGRIPMNKTTLRGETNMKLYEVNKQIEELLAKMEPDPETGEIKAGEEEIIEEIDELAQAVARNDILENMAKLYMNTKAMLEEIQAQKTSLEERSKRMQLKQGNLLKILDRECDKKNADLGVAKLRHRTNKAVEITDADAAFKWLKRKGHSECYRIHNPEIKKEKVGKLLDSGEKIPGVKRVSSVSCYLS